MCRDRDRDNSVVINVNMVNAPPTCSHSYWQGLRIIVLCAVDYGLGGGDTQR